MSRDRAKILEEECLKQINTYLDSVYALLCLGGWLTWDEKTDTRRTGALFFLGRRMQTSPNNTHLKSGRITPDLVALVNPNYGVLAEAKASFHGNTQARQAYLEQLMKYDDDLTGWPTTSEKVQAHDLALLVDYSRKADAIAILDEAVKTGILKLTRKLAGVTFTRAQRTDEYMMLEHFWGDWSDPAIKKRLGPLTVRLEAVLPKASIRLYDDCPPIPHLIELAWTFVFPQLIPVEGYDQKDLVIECTTKEIRDRLQDTCTHREATNNQRQPEIPQRAWIETMMDILTQMGLAEELNKDEGRYKVFYKQRTLQYFIKHYIKLTHKESKPTRGRKRGRRSDNQEGQLRFFGS